jgi:hypothetical protein
MKQFCRITAYITLLLDAYLLLASVATMNMKTQYHAYLPPFSLRSVEALPRALIVLVVGWTALLAVACLLLTNRR